MLALRTTTALLVVTLMLAACGDDAADAPDDGSAGVPAVDGTVPVEAGDLYFDPDSITAEAGTIEFWLDNVGAMEHDIVIEEAGDVVVAHADPGATESGSIDLEAGTYTFYCSIPGHRSAMEGTIEVR